jgi:chemotaxis protein MotB
MQTSRQTESLPALKAKSVWLLSFGDVVTLLITFFILLIAVNKGEITKIQKWNDQVLEANFLQLKSELSEFEKRNRETFRLSYALDGIKIRIPSDQAFEKGDYQPLPALQAQLQYLGETLPQLSLFHVHQNPKTAEVVKAIEKQGYRWQVEINVAGHTDSDPVDPRSPVRNNWILSTLRAQTVAEGLAKSSGLSPKLFSVSGYGAYRPLVPNDTPEHKAMNRRVEVTVRAYFLQKLTKTSQSQAEGRSPANQ